MRMEVGVPAPRLNRRLAVDELIERLRKSAAHLRSTSRGGLEYEARLQEEAAAALEAAREDAERLDWFDTNWFTAYRNCDPIGLSKHCVLVDESQRTRRRCVADTFRTAIDQARGKAGQPGETM
jgi:hypothetical protein